MRLALAVALTLVPTIAAARPFTAGVNLGVDQSKESGLNGEDASHTPVSYTHLTLPTNREV